MSAISNLKSSDQILLVDSTNKFYLKSVFENKNANITCVDSSTVSSVASTFNFIIVSASVDERDNVVSLVSKFLTLLKPRARLYLYIHNANDEDRKQLEVSLLLAGLINIRFVDELFSWKLDGTAVEVKFPVDNIACLVSEKPNYEIGSSKPISLSNESTNKASVWKLQDTDDDLIDDDDLLDEEDLKKPDPSSLRVCGTTGQRKACKDCSCGLAEELESEKAEKRKDTENAKSSCGSCYLGDAFRCASCPYLGMPAFKPGEKILLSDQFLSPDI